MNLCEIIVQNPYKRFLKFCAILSLINSYKKDSYKEKVY